MFARNPTSESKSQASRSNGPAAPFFQPKLTVNTPGDAYEQEADAVADQVMRMRTGDAPVVQRMPVTPVSVQRACAACESKQKEEERVQRKETGGGDAGGKAAPSVVSDVLSSGGGQAMDGGTRQFMESRFGQDFSSVRIHTDSRAAESASAIQARAYTSGNNIVFGRGEYRPDSDGGKRLLAHELVHVGQQGGGGVKRNSFGSFMKGLFTNPFKTIARLFGSENYSTEELTEYLNKINSTKKIEDNFDSDNKARAITKRMLEFKSLVNTNTKVLLIREMLSGATLGGDENAIINLLDNASQEERIQIVSEIGRSNLWGDFSGKNLHILKAITLTDKDAASQDIIQHIQSLSVEEIEIYENRAKDSKIIEIAGKAKAAKKITMPLDIINTTFTDQGSAKIIVPGFDVTVLPDKIDASIPDTADAVTNIKVEADQTDITKVMVNSETQKIASWDGPIPIRVKIQTIYPPTTDLSKGAGYGRGTTREDRRAGNTSLGFHEGQHGVETIKYLLKNRPPQFKGQVGMSVEAFRDAIADYLLKVNFHYQNALMLSNIKTVDCPGTSITSEQLKGVGVKTNICIEN